jgi:hypothetical protein
VSDREQRLRDILRRPLEDVIAPRSQSRLATISTAFDRTGKVRPDALSSALLLARDVTVGGTASTGTAVAAPLRMPQAARVVRLYADARTAPSVGEYTADLYANGGYVASVSIASGLTAGVSSVSLPEALVESGALLTWNVTAASGAANVTLSIIYRVNDA